MPHAVSLCLWPRMLTLLQWYNDHEPIVKPSWGSLIFLIVLGILTPLIYFGYDVALPLAPFIHPGDILYSLFDVKVEVVLQFCMSVLWVSGTLAYFEDLGGRAACTFDSYYHYAMPDDFDHVCSLRDLVWKLCWAAFGLQVLLFLFETLIAAYIFIFLDQEVLNEPHYAWGRRAYDFQRGRHTTQQSTRAARATRAPAPGHNEYHDYPEYDEPAAYSRGLAPNYDYDYEYHDEPRSRSRSRSLSQSHMSLGSESEHERDYDDRSLLSRGTTHRSRASARRGGAYNTRTPAEPTPSEEGDDDLHEAGPYVGPDEWMDTQGFASNRERGYDRGADEAQAARLESDYSPAPAPDRKAVASHSVRSTRSARSLSDRGASQRGSSRLTRRRSSAAGSHRRGPSYASLDPPPVDEEGEAEEEHLPALGARGRRAYLPASDEE